MAQMLPREISHLKNATPGEKSLFRIIQKKLPDNWICYAGQRLYERSVKDNVRPDFVLIGPDLGVLVIEEKSIPLNLINNATTSNWTVIRNGKESTETHPLEQARKYILQITDLCQKIKKLRNDKGKLKFPYGHGVILSSISRSDLMQTETFKTPLINTFNPELIICENEIPKLNEPGDDFINRIKKMTGYFNFEPIDQQHIDDIRYAIYPECRAYCLGDSLNDKNATLNALTIEQEQLVRGIGKHDNMPHRLIRGVVGSGKSLVLKARAIEIASENPDWNILLTFFTRSLIGFFKEGMPPNVEIKTLGQAVWQLWNVSQLDNDKFNSNDDIFFQTIVDEFKSENLKTSSFDAIFVDEVQDLSPEKAECLRFMLNKNTNCAFFAGDGIQNIFNKKVVWKDHGFEFVGRSSKQDFSINYRNTEEIFNFAWAYREKFSPNNGDDNYYSKISFKRKGPTPYLKIYDTFENETEGILNEIIRLIHTQSVQPHQIAILHPFATEKGMHTIEPYIQMLTEKNIPFNWLSKNQMSKLNYKQYLGGVVISTPHSAKGLEWEIVFTPSLNTYIPERAASLTFVANTRAREILYPSEVGQ